MRHPAAVPWQWGRFYDACPAAIWFVGVFVTSLACPMLHAAEGLHEAAEAGVMDAVKRFTERGANVNSTDRLGRTPLYVAALNGHQPVVVYLLQHKANPNKRASKKGGQTPLHVAARYGYTEIMEVLIQHGAEIDARDDSGQSPLHRAAWYGRAQAVKLLLDRGADVRARDTLGYTALHFQYEPPGKAERPEHADFKAVVELLLEQGLDVNTAATHRLVRGWTPLMAASGVAPTEVIELLLAKGADVRAKTERGATALSVAQGRNRQEVVTLLTRALRTPDNTALPK